MILDQVQRNKTAAEKRAKKVDMDAKELIRRCNENHFAQGWLAIIRPGGAK